MRIRLLLVFGLVLLILAACGPKVCEPGSRATPLPSGISNGEVRIRSKSIWMDKIVHGSFCQDTWSGSVYVACDAQVSQWVDKPVFLDGCSLSIEPGTVVYVAKHNNEAYYNGCSCHYTETSVTP